MAHSEQGDNMEARGPEEDERPVLSVTETGQVTSTSVQESDGVPYQPVTMGTCVQCHAPVEAGRWHRCTHLVTCPYCEEPVEGGALAHHAAVCPERPVPCPSGCRRTLPRADIPAHVSPATGDCPRRACLYGCPIPGGGRSHNSLSLLTHGWFLLSFVLFLLATYHNDRESDLVMVNARTVLEYIRVTMEAVTNSVRASGLVPDPPSRDPRNPSTSIDDAFSTSLGNEDGSTDDDNDRRVLRQTRGSWLAEFARVRQMALAWSRDLGDTLGERMRAAVIARLRENAALGSLIETIIRVRGAQRDLRDALRSDAEQIHALQRQVADLELRHATADAEMAEQDLRLQELQMTSYDGTLVWRIGDVWRKRLEAISGQTPSICSPPFYTSSAGYKMCTRIYLNGDGMGRGTHISLFFVLIRGQYDALQPWPFRQKVTMTMLSQEGGDHVIDSFGPDPESLSFRRPESDMNVASGCPLFVKLSALEEINSPYVQDGTMFIKVQVHLDGL